MKDQRIIIALFLVFFSFPVVQARAEGNWWEQALDVLTTLDETAQASGIDTSEIDTSEIGRAFKEALRIGSDHVVDRLGNVDGFNADPVIHIPLPKELNTVKLMLAKFGISQVVDDLELKLNRAAEAATPKAKELFRQSITQMTFDDIQSIYKGPEDSATRYFKAKMSPLLKEEMRPIIAESLSTVGAIQAFDKVMGTYQSLPFVQDIKTNLTNHVVQKGMDGIFYYIAKEEAAIRKDPVKQTTALLRKVFGDQ